MTQDLSPRIRWLEETVRGDHILDIGFVGEYEESAVHRRIADENPDATLIGFDMKEKVAKRTIDQGIQGDLFRLPFERRSFDSVVFAEVLEHLESPVDAIEEIARVLKPGGRLYLTTPNPFGLYRYLRHYLFSRQLDPEFYLGTEDHVQFLDPLSLSNILTESGFMIEELTFRNVTIPRFPTLPDWEFLKRFPFSRGGSYTCLIAIQT